jgi:hypothetical protein
MGKDILSLFVVNEITLSLIKKILRLVLVLLICSLIYAVLDLTQWYSLLTKTSDSTKNSNFYFYSIRPIINLIITASSIIGYILFTKGLDISQLQLDHLIHYY